jgi:hypothetical protein
MAQRRDPVPKHRSEIRDIDALERGQSFDRLGKVGHGPAGIQQRESPHRIVHQCHRFTPSIVFPAFKTGASTSMMLWQSATPFGLFGGRGFLSRRIHSKRTAGPGFTGFGVVGQVPVTRQYDGRTLSPRFMKVCEKSSEAGARPGGNGLRRHGQALHRDAAF